MEKRVSNMKTLLPMNAPNRWLFVLPRLPALSVLLVASLMGACSTAPSLNPIKSPQPKISSKNLPPPSPGPRLPTQAVGAAANPDLMAEAQGILIHPLPPITPLETVGDAPQATDPLRPGVNLSEDANPRADLWSRVRSGFGIPDLDNDLVRAREEWYATRPDYVDRMTQRGSRYLFHIVEEVSRRKMPTELALLPFIESAFNPEALSSAKASGIWQFMPATGKDFALKQNIFRDDRRSVLASTRAALDYLQRLYGMFGDWHLALAAYNWGEGNVRRAIHRNRSAGLPTDYVNLKMPQETQNYVPKLQAVKNIVMNPGLFGLRLPPLENHPYFLSVPIDRDIDVELAARLAQMSVAEFKALNPQMNKPLILAAGTPQILLPYDNANSFVQNLAKHRGAMASWTAWVAPKTIRTIDAAKQWQWTETALREINRIPPKMLIKAGSTLLVPRQSQSPDRVAEHIVDNALIALAPEPPPLRRLVVRTQAKDTLTGIAHRYQVQAEQIIEWNKIPPKKPLKAQQTLVIYVPHSFKLPQTTARSPSNQRQRVRVADSQKSASSKPIQMASSGTSKHHPNGANKFGVASNR